MRYPEAAEPIQGIANEASCGPQRNDYCWLHHAMERGVGTIG